MSDFLELARKVQARGMSVTEAVSKFKSALHRAGAPKKKAAKKPIRIVKDGIRIYPDGHERCLTDAAWLKRREELFERGNYCCENRECLMPLLILGAMHAHHVRKRSVGRDDRLSNLLGLCGDCHNKKHDEFRK